jgi:hypothetical protein
MKEDEEIKLDNVIIILYIFSYVFIKLKFLHFLNRKIMMKK